MACEEYSSLLDYLRNFNGSDPVGAVVCPFVHQNGGNIPMVVFSLFVFGFVGLALTIRVQHPGPIVVALILSAGVMGSLVPGIAAKMMALVILFILVGGGLYLYQRSQSAL